MAHTKEQLALSEADAKKITAAMKEAFADVLPLSLQRDEIFRPGTGYSRRGAPDPVATGTYALRADLPPARWNSAFIYFEGVRDIYQQIADTLAQETVARKTSVGSRHDALSGMGIYDNDPAPTRSLPLEFTTTDMSKLKPAFAKAAAAAEEKIGEAKQAGRLLAKLSRGAGMIRALTIDAGGRDSTQAFPNLLFYQPDTVSQYGQRALSQGAEAVDKVLETLERRGAISRYGYNHGEVITLKSLEKLQAILESEKAVQTPRTRAR